MSSNDPVINLRGDRGVGPLWPGIAATLICGLFAASLVSMFGWPGLLVLIAVAAIISAYR